MPSKKWTPEAIRDNFSYHAPTPEAVKQHAAITEASIAFATVVVDNTPESADQTLAIRDIENARMRANKAIATGGKY